VAPATAASLTAVPLSTLAFCTGPAGSSLDVTTLTSTDANRWSEDGEPTIYLAGDPGVAVAELGRHWGEQDGEMAIWSLTLGLDGAADLRDPVVRSSLRVPDDPRWILDKKRCHELASRLRSSGPQDGLVVPSVAFLDDTSRWNAVVFVDRLRTTLVDAISSARPVVRLVRTESDAQPD
jgi:RES domain-containing protein